LRNIQRIEEDDFVDKNDSDSGDSNTAFLSLVNRIDTRASDDFAIKLHVSPFPEKIKFLIDTGADVTCISEKCIPNNLRNKINPLDRNICGPDNQKLLAKEFLNVKIAKDSKIVKSKIYVIRNLKNNLLGKPKILKLNVTRKVYKMNMCTNKQTNLNSILRKYGNVFKGLDRLKKELKIHIKEDAKSLFQSTPRAVTIPLLSKLRKELDILRSLGVIEPADYPID